MNRLRKKVTPSVGIIGGEDYALNKTLKKIEDLGKEIQAEQCNEGKEKVYSSTFPTRLTPEEFKKHYGWYNPDSAIESEPEEDDEE